jgi:hypothetical protein
MRILRRELGVWVFSGGHAPGPFRGSAGYVNDHNQDLCQDKGCANSA